MKKKYLWEQNESSVDNHDQHFIFFNYVNKEHLQAFHIN